MSPPPARVAFPSLILAIACSNLLQGQEIGRGSTPPARPNPRISRATLEALYRPTVMILKGHARGSGTVVASYPGETLILTAAHVVAGAGELYVECQPYNFGVEKDPKYLAGPWPRRLAGEIAAQDPAADVAVVRVRGRTTMPYVSRVALLAEEPARGDILTSVGVDQSDPMTGWMTDVQGVATVDIGKGGAARFIFTTRAPEHGRSGGGLFLRDGTIVGVCVGRLEPKDSSMPVRGVFASIESIRELLRSSGLETRLAHSEAYRRVNPRRVAVPPPPEAVPGGR